MTQPKPSEFFGGNIKLPAAGATNNLFVYEGMNTSGGSDGHCFII